MDVEENSNSDHGPRLDHSYAGMIPGVQRRPDDIVIVPRPLHVRRSPDVPRRPDPSERSRPAPAPVVAGGISPRLVANPERFAVPVAPVAVVVRPPLSDHVERAPRHGAVHLNPLPVIGTLVDTRNVVVYSARQVMVEVVGHAIVGPVVEGVEVLLFD